MADGIASGGIDPNILTTINEKTVTNKDIDGGTASNTNRMTMPKGTKAALDALDRKEGTYVYATDLEKFYLDNGTALIEVSGGGEGGKNHIVDGDAEGFLVGDTYADAAGTSPVDMTGGSATTTWALNSSSPLADDADFLLTKDAANRQGEGVAFTTETIDPAYMYRQHTVEFDYKMSANYADGDIRVYVYDITNSQVIEPVGVELMTSSVNGHHKCTFQTTDSTSYRVGLHIASTNATAYTVNVDNFKMTPIISAQGFAGSDWTSFTPVINNLVTTGAAGRWRRAGDSMHIRVEAVPNGVASSQISVNLPSGYSIDTVKLTGTGTSDQNLGTAQARPVNAASADVYLGSVQYASATAVRIYGNDQAGAGQLWSINYPDTWVASGDSFALDFIVPIEGWNSNTIMSDDATQREVSMRYSGTTSGTLTTSWNTITYPTENHSTHAAYSGGVYTVPVSGRYAISALMEVTGTFVITQYLGLMISVNGAESIAKYYRAHGSVGIMDASVETAGINLVKGQTVEIKAITNATSPLHVAAGSLNTVSIAKVGDPSTISASEKTLVRLSNDSGLSLDASTTETLTWNTIDKDTHGIFNGTHTITVPEAGDYMIEAYILTDTLTWTAANTMEMFVTVDGGNYAEMDHTTVDATGARYMKAGGGVMLHDLTKGQAVAINVYHTRTGGAIAELTNVLYNHLGFYKIK